VEGGVKFTVSNAEQSRKLATGSLWEDTLAVEVAEVVVDADAPDLLPVYTYRVPDLWKDMVQLGTCVHVPFGGQEKLGYVLARRRMALADPLCARLRDIIAPVEGAITFSQEQAEIAGWVAEEYICPLASSLRCVAPAAMGARVVTQVRLVEETMTAKDAGNATSQVHILDTLRALGGVAEREKLREASKVSSFTTSYAALLRKGLIRETRHVSRPRTQARTVRAYTLKPMENASEARISEVGRRILQVLAECAEAGKTLVTADYLLEEAQASESALQTLVRKGIVDMRKMLVCRNPHVVPATRTQPPRLTPAQRAAVEWIADSLTKSTPQTALLYGVTASGKTEVYLDAIAHTLEAGRTAIVLVPEIALTTQVVEVFTGRFGDEVAVLHSRLSDGERYDEWRRLQQKQARIVVGARSAIFAPVENVGLIVVDEEHEASYKQESTPRYHARDVAAERARRAGATLLLGSATPSLETYYASEQGRITRLEMPERIDNRPLPEVSIVDLREEFKEHRALFSRRLMEEIRIRLSQGQQAILFLNRRGYAQCVLCRECGHVMRCPHCAVSLTFHAAQRALRCHHCDYSRLAPTACPACGGTRIRGFGIGTERVEEEVIKHFPQARVARLDRDTAARKGAHAGILGRFRRGEVDILIGTQMVAKGLDFPNVTLVGIVSADTAIHLPDFRAAERAFQLLTQVAGRAGRGAHPGLVIIQTFCPNHYSVQMATRQDYPGFYQQEIAFRRELLYPPFSRFANLISTDEDEARARLRAVAMAEAFRDTLPPEIELIGPAPCPLSRLKNVYRWHVALRAPLDAPLSRLVREGLTRLSSTERMDITVDIDPMGMA